MKQSALLTKTRKNISHEEQSLNAQLLERAGFITKLMAGVYTFLPLGIRVLTNIENIVRQEMNAIDGQELLLPALHPKDPWLQTERWDKVDVLFKLKGAGDRDLCLGPTHEEIVTPVAALYLQSYKDLPQAVYQIQTKFRNEARAKSGLLRGREFRMKDLYSFHSSTTELDEYYEKAIHAYRNIFARCGLGHLTYLTFASGGIFAKYSHEFQTITQYGEDIIYLCASCKIAVNSEIIAEQNKCPECGNTQLEEKKSIEVGNIFKLMARFTKAFNVTVADQHGKAQEVVMGCYGLGTSRLMGAIAEILHDERGLVWPVEVAPFKVHLISLVKTDEEHQQATHLYHTLQNNGIEVLWDDRHSSAGKKFADADLIGLPWRVVISSKTLAQQAVEIKARNSNQAQLIGTEKIIDIIRL